MNENLLLWLSLAGLVAGSITAVAARCLHNFSRHELEVLCERHHAQDRFAQILREHERVALGTEMIALLFVALGLCAGAVWSWNEFASASPLPVPVFFLIVLVLGQLAAILTVWLPWSMTRLGSAPFIYRSWPLWSLVGRLATPLVVAAAVVDALLHRLTGTVPHTSNEDSFEAEIRTIVSEGHREGLLEENAAEMIESVMELGDAVVSHIMTPRTEIQMIQADSPWSDIVDKVVEWGHTRIPAYGASRDEIVGILYTKDLLPELAKPADRPRRSLGDLLRKPLFVPETKPVDDLLKLFQKSRTHIAVVLDEFAGVSGIVTIEDVLEEIVGEIDDEHDPVSEEEVHPLNDDACIALGRAHIDDINELMGFELPEEEDFDTIGGFVFTQLGRLPTAGESLTWKDSLLVTVLEASRRRVHRVRIERIRQDMLEAV